MTQNNSKTQGKKLLWVTILNFSITIVQIIGGLLSNSLSLLSDAVHNLGDAMALFIAFIANKLSRREANLKSTFGYKRIEILAALFNSVVLIVICIFLFKEAYERFYNPQPIKGMMMLVVASFGLLANFFSVFILHNFKDENLNIKAAYLHLVGDTISSVAVIIGGVLIWLYEINWIDPLVTVILGVYIIIETWKVVRETIEILMHFTPREVNLKEIQKELESFDLIKNIHHVHVWKLTDSRLQFEAHIELKSDEKLSTTTKFTSKISNYLKNSWGINHVTIQYEFESEDEHLLISKI
jgi:cobalt-zinc-cadmium efflux system protein